MSNAFLYRMPAGIAGNINRAAHATVEAGIYDASYPCLAFGILTSVISGKIRPIASGNTIANLKSIGWLVRPYPINDQLGAAAGSEALGQGAPPTSGPADILKRGYMSVLVTDGGATDPTSIAKGDAVYVRTTADTGKAVGDIEAGTSSGNEVVVGAYFTGPADSNGFTEIAFNI